jgi:hypothetical protein
MELEELAFFLDSEIYLLESDHHSSSSTPGLRFYGENKAQICCVLNYEGMFNKSADFELIQKILQALKLTLLETAIINLNENPGLSWQQIHLSLSPKVVILFGVEPSILAILGRIAVNEPSLIHGVKFLWTAALSTIASDQAVKRELWSALKELFQ